MKETQRRRFLKGIAMGSLLLSSGVLAQRATGETPVTPKRPKRLSAGNTVALVAPAGVTYEQDYLAMAQESLEALELRVKLGKNVLNRFGYLAGTDKQRAQDINRAFADDNVDGIFCLRGGWGAARILEHLDFPLITHNPKVFVGYSDITTLLNSLYARCGLVTFHGPNGGSAWVDFSVDKMRALLFDASPMTMEPHTLRVGTLAPRINRIQTIVPGTARGKLVGGNLSLLTNLIGTPYFPDVQDHILLIEEIGEYIYRCDRMFSQLANAGVLDRVSGVVLGSFTDCEVEPSGGYGTFALMDVFEHYFKDRAKPVYFGASFGHLEEKYTLPIGIEAEMDAGQGTVELLSPSVT